MEDRESNKAVPVPKGKSWIGSKGVRENETINHYPHSVSVYPLCPEWEDWAQGSGKEGCVCVSGAGQFISCYKNISNQ